MVLSLLGLTTGLGLLYLYWIAKHGTLENTQHDVKLLDSDLRLRQFKSKHRWAEHRTTFLNFGLVFALGFVSLAFEYKSAAIAFIGEKAPELSPIIEIDVLRTPAEKPVELPPPPEPSNKKLDLTDKFELVDAVEPKNEPEFLEDLPVVAPKDSVVRYVKPVASPVAPPRPPEPTHEDLRPVSIVEQMPRYIGCETDRGDGFELPTEADAIIDLLNHVQGNVKYPRIARENDIEGVAIITFIIEKDGSLSEPKIVRNPGGGTGEEALRVVQTLCDWEPGRQAGRRVRVQYNLPVKFKLSR